MYDFSNIKLKMERIFPLQGFFDPFSLRCSLVFSWRMFKVCELFLIGFFGVEWVLVEGGCKRGNEEGERNDWGFRGVGKEYLNFLFGDDTDLTCQYRWIRFSY